jgi:hypothetical protein
VQSINITQFAKQYAPQIGAIHQQPNNRKRQKLDTFIDASTSGGTGYFAVVIYSNRQRIAHFSGWIDNSTAERTWLHALSLAFEWRDQHAPDARLKIYSLNEQPRQERKKAA